MLNQIAYKKKQFGKIQGFVGVKGVQFHLTLKLCSIATIFLFTCYKLWYLEVKLFFEGCFLK